MAGAFKRNLRGLQRVFKRLCNYAAKAKHLHTVEEKAARQAKLTTALKRPENKMIDPTGKPMTQAEVQEELTVTNAEIANFQTLILKINNKGKEKISYKDLMEILKDLGAPMSKEEVKEMVWEVDEDLDEHVSWKEFSAMYQRSMTDKSGLEPSGLYNLAQFMLYDKDFNGTVSMDETMMMLYQRYGKNRLQEELQKLFGRDLNGDGELTFIEYLSATEINISMNEKPKIRGPKNTKPKKTSKSVKANRASKGPRALARGRR